MSETTDRPGLEELAESMNGFEEIAVQKSFGLSVEQLEGTIAARAFVFVELKRGGAKDAAAYKESMEMTLRGLTERFPEMNEDKTADPMAGIREDEGKA